jgi:hypothetical protein
MTSRSLRWGVVAAGFLIGVYVAVLTTAAGWSPLGDQVRADWRLLTPIVVGFGTQVALIVELRRRRRARRLAASTGAGASASAVGMVACCAHHVADLIPVVGATGVAAFVFDFRIPFMLAGIAINAAAVAVAASRLHRLSR